MSPNLWQVLLYLKRAALTPTDLLPAYPKSALDPDKQTACKHPLIWPNIEHNLLVRDVFASIDKSENDIAQCWQRKTEARASLPVFAEHFHTATQVNKVQAAATSRHCHKQRKQTVSMCLQKQLPRKDCRDLWRGNTPEISPNSCEQQQTVGVLLTPCQPLLLSTLTCLTMAGAFSIHLLLQV